MVELKGKPEERIYPHGIKAVNDAIERTLKNINSKGKEKYFSYNYYT